jgi:hypothetical protein
MTQPTLYGEPVNDVPHAKGSRTSRMAAERISQDMPKHEAKRDRLLRAYVSAGSRGLTDHEASEATNLPRSSICSLRAALVACACVTNGVDADGVEVTRLGPYGHQQTVWVATTAGREAAA